MGSSFFFGLSTMPYITAMMIYIAYLAFKKTQVGVTATIITITGFIAQTTAIILSWSEFAELSVMGFMRSAPLTNLYESLIFIRLVPDTGISGNRI